MSMFERADPGQRYVHDLAAAYTAGFRVYDPSHAGVQAYDFEMKILRAAPFAHALFRRWERIAGRRISVQAPDEGTDTDKALAKVCAQLVACVDGFTNARKMLARADFSGMRFAEIEWETRVERFGDGKPRLWDVPVRMVDHAKEVFRWVRVDARDGKEPVRTELQRWKVEKNDWVPVTRAESLIRHTFDESEETLGYGRGLREALWFLWHGWTHVRGERIATAEAFGRGRLVLKLDHTAKALVGKTTAQIVAEAHRTIDKMRAKHTFVISKNDELVLLDYPTGAAEAMGQLDKEFKEEALQLCLGGVLPTGGGEDVGSNSRAMTEQDSEDDVISTCSDHLEESYTRDLVGRVVARNWANVYELGLADAQSSRFSILRGQRRDPLKSAQLLDVVLRRAPVKTSQFYELVDLEEPGPDDEVIQPMAQPVLPGGAPSEGGFDGQQ